MRPYLLITLLLALPWLFSCDGGDNGGTTSIDRKPYLENWGTALIVPAYQQLDAKAAALNQKATAFATSPTNVNLEALRLSWKDAYLAWQACAPFEFGPADNAGLKGNVNIFPTDTVLISSNIALGTHDFTLLSNKAAKGFPALDFLLYGVNGKKVLASYTGSNAANHKAYLQALTADIQAKASQVYTAWKSDGGNYLATFVAADGADLGSSLGAIVNNMDEDYEVAKNFKIGVPAGIKSLGQLFPEKCEAYYSGFSLEMLKANFNTTQRIFLGNSLSGQQGKGLDDMLIALKAAKLSTDINAQFDKVIQSIDAIPGPLSEAVSKDAASVQNAYNAAQQAVVLIKIEMPSVVGVQISYQDGDSD